MMVRFDGWKRQVGLRVGSTVRLGGRWDHVDGWKKIPDDAWKK